MEGHLPNPVVEIVKNKQNELLSDNKIQKQKNDKKLIEPTESSRIFDRTLKFLTVFGVLLGTDFNYEWKCNKRFTFAKILTLFFWFINISTQALHVYSHTIIGTLEQFAIYGIGISVTLNAPNIESNYNEKYLRSF